MRAFAYCMLLIWICVFTDYGFVAKEGFKVDWFGCARILGEGKLEPVINRILKIVSWMKKIVSLIISSGRSHLADKYLDRNNESQIRGCVCTKGIVRRGLSRIVFGVHLSVGEHVKATAVVIWSCSPLHLQNKTEIICFTLEQIYENVYSRRYFEKNRLFTQYYATLKFTNFKF